LPLADRLRPGIGRLTDARLAFPRVRDAVAHHYPQADLTSLRAAYDLAEQAHHGQNPGYGEAYITHPLAAAQILADIGIDPVAVTAAILHDVPEDTDFTPGRHRGEVRRGSRPTRRRRGPSCPSSAPTATREQQAENIRKMFLAMADDIRVVLIKLADRLHKHANAVPAVVGQAGSHRPPDPRDLTLRWPSASASGALSGSSRTWPSRRSSRTPTASWRACSTPAGGAARHLSAAPSTPFDRNWPRLESRPSCRADRNTCTASGRNAAQEREIGEIYDVYAIRVLVEEVKDCYAALGVVHSMWRPIPNQFGRLHRRPQAPTSIRASNGSDGSGRPAARDPDPDPDDAPGSARSASPAHWRCTRKGSRADREYDAKLAWLRQVMDWQRDVSDATEFVEA